MNLVIGDGGVKGAIMLGALNYYIKIGRLQKIKKLYGCSIGSAIGVILIMNNNDIDDILQYMFNIDFKEFNQLNINSLLNDFGLCGNKIITVLENYIKRYMDPYMTIAEFDEKFNCNVNLMATSLANRKTVILCSETYGDMPIISAIGASCSIPVLFSPVIFKGDVLVDGAVSNYVKEIPTSVFSENTISIFLSMRQFTSNKLTLRTYISELLFTCFNHDLSLVESQNPTLCTSLILDTSGIDIDATNYSKADKHVITNYFYRGIEQAHANDNK
jgi:predicted acylesterase/phospholipase RssA